ncbi:MAG: non-canonical purine NTP pyrophosphatase, partial [Thermoplasmata archaeon]
SLSNFPGVYSAYVFKRIGCKGILKLMEDKKDRYAEFRSVIVYKEKGKRTKIFIGKCEGEIAFEEKGNRGFGFDPIFIPYGSSKTFGEMDVEEKNKYSHRGKSVEMLVKYLEKMRNH